MPCFNTPHSIFGALTSCSGTASLGRSLRKEAAKSLKAEGEGVSLRKKAAGGVAGSSPVVSASGVDGVKPAPCSALRSNEYCQMRAPCFDQKLSKQL